MSDSMSDSMSFDSHAELVALLNPLIQHGLAGTLDRDMVSDLRGGNVGGSSTAEIQVDNTPPPPVKFKTKRKRSMIACKSCNERRVRCDGASCGLPCSSCRHSGKLDCAFIDSKRVRGKRGRFESKDGPTQEEENDGERLDQIRELEEVSPIKQEFLRENFGGPILNSRNHILNHRPGQITRRHSISAVEARPSPGSDHEVWARLLGNSTSIRNAGRVAYLGEPWIMSWVVHETDPSDKSLHRPIPDSEGTNGKSHAYARDLWDKGVFMLPPLELQEKLVEEFFLHFVPVFPIIDKQKFIESWRSRTFSYLLMQAVLFMGATHIETCHLREAGFAKKQDAIELFYRRAKALYDADVETDRISQLQAMFILQFHWGLLTEHKDTIWWATGAIRLAQSTGMHRSTARVGIVPEDKRLWKKLWWQLYIRDRQLASAMGKPFMIHELDCDVEELTLEDFVDGESRETALYTIEMVTLAKLITRVLRCEFSPGRKWDETEHREKKMEVHLAMEKWRSNIRPEIRYDTDSNRSFFGLILLMAYYQNFMMLHRPNLDKSTRVYDPNDLSTKMANQAANQITALAEDLMKYWAVRQMPIFAVTSLFAAMTYNVVETRGREADKVEALSQKIKTNLLCLREFEEQYSVAGWIRRIFEKILDHWGTFDKKLYDITTDSAQTRRARFNARANSTSSTASSTVSGPLSSSSMFLMDNQVYLPNSSPVYKGEPYSVSGLRHGLGHPSVYTSMLGMGMADLFSHGADPHNISATFPVVDESPSPPQDVTSHHSDTSSHQTLHPETPPSSVDQHNRPSEFEDFDGGIGSSFEVASRLTAPGSILDEGNGAAAAAASLVDSGGLAGPRETKGAPGFASLDAITVLELQNALYFRDLAERERGGARSVEFSGRETRGIGMQTWVGE